ncbi:MAG TPA: PEGA domain-containing protein [Vicinamibacterales bacterium]|nr:PEGA domain-containing protein [Vicinamibacterales bacterium]
MKHLRRRVVISSVVLISGCASVVHKAPGFGGGTTVQEIEVTSEPAGARVFLRGAPAGITPTRLRLIRKDPHQVVRLEKDGYRSVDVPIRRKVSGAVAGNIPFGLLALNPLNGPNGLSDNPWSRSEQVAYAFILPAIGVGVDFLTGAAYALPSRVHVTLEPNRAGPNGRPPAE